MIQPIRRTLFFALVLGLALLAGTAASSAGTSVLTVTKTEDTADGICDSDCSLREAVIAANADPDLSTVEVPAGLYKITIAGFDNNGQTGDFDLVGDTSVEGAGVDETVIDGNTLDSVFHVVSTNPSSRLTEVTLHDLTVRGGTAANDPQVFAGGVYANGELTLDSVHVTDNNGGNAGAGGVLADYRLVIKDSLVDGNSSGESGVGGALASGGAEIESTTISNNDAAGAHGVGGLSLAGDVDLTDVTIDGNSASGETGTGGLYIVNSESAHIERLRITNNSAPADYGAGGLRLNSEANGVDLDVSSNVGGRFGAGGALVECCHGALDLTNATISGNSSPANSGAGVWNDGESILANVTISGNTAGDASVGGLYNSGAMTLTYGTVTNNTADGAGGVLNDGDLSVANSIVAGNQTTECGAGRGVLHSGGGNLDSASACGFDQPSDHPSAGDPLLAALADNGGFAKTHRLLSGSPAIDAANGCPSPSTDERRVHRPSGSGCDSGAFELQDAGQLIWGDLDCDGLITSSDAQGVLSFESGVPGTASCSPAIGDTLAIDGVSRIWGDVDCDGQVTPNDALFILRWMAATSLAPADGCPELQAPVTAA